MNCFKLLLLFLLISPAALGQSTFVSFLPEKSIWQRCGNTVDLELYFEIATGYHIQGHEPNNDNFIPTTLILDPLLSETICQIDFPTPKELLLDQTGSVKVYSEILTINLQLEVPSTQTWLRSSGLKGELHYQACDARKCFFPRTLDFEIPTPPFSLKGQS